MNIEIEDWPDGFSPLGFVISIEALDPDGDLMLINRRSGDTTAWKALGMAQSLCDDLRASLREPEEY